MERGQMSENEKENLRIKLEDEVNRLEVDIDKK